jgi:8-oxo-dGTP pyrophosphatase MutT (NUDIX family)
MSGTPVFTEASLREPLRRLLANRARGTTAPGSARPSAVLAPLFERGGEVHVLVVLRAQGMRDHSGQMAFPGGKFDPVDDSLLATALREAQEEIGLAPDGVDVLGALDDFATTTGFVITPYVGWIREDVVLSPNASEVARVIATPIAAFLEKPSGLFPRIGWKLDGELLWGASAAIVRGLMTLAREAVGTSGA